MKILLLPFILQALLMGIDEMFHLKRGLGKWERIGHPLDTLSVLIPLSLTLLIPYSSLGLRTYVGLAIFSCLFITKDEWVHQQECSPLEHWLHAILFVLHPLTFLSAGLLWRAGDLTALTGVVGVTFVFLTYQLFRWSIPWQIKRT